MKILNFSSVLMTTTLLLSNAAMAESPKWSQEHVRRDSSEVVAQAVANFAKMDSSVTMAIDVALSCAALQGDGETAGLAIALADKDARGNLVKAMRDSQIPMHAHPRPQEVIDQANLKNVVAAYQATDRFLISQIEASTSKSAPIVSCYVNKRK